MTDTAYDDPTPLIRAEIRSLRRRPSGAFRWSYTVDELDQLATYTREDRDDRAVDRGPRVWVDNPPEHVALELRRHRHLDTDPGETVTVAAAARWRALTHRNVDGVAVFGYPELFPGWYVNRYAAERGREIADHALEQLAAGDTLYLRRTRTHHLAPPDRDGVLEVPRAQLVADLAAWASELELRLELDGRGGISTEAAAYRLGTSAREVRRWIDRGELEGWQENGPGGRWLVDPNAPAFRARRVAYLEERGGDA